MAENNSPSGHRRKLSRVVRRLRVSGTCLMEKVLSTAAREDPLGRARGGLSLGARGRVSLAVGIGKILEAKSKM